MPSLQQVAMVRRWNLRDRDTPRRGGDLRARGGRRAAADDSRTGAAWSPERCGLETDARATSREPVAEPTRWPPARARRRGPPLLPRGAASTLGYRRSRWRSSGGRDRVSLARRLRRARRAHFCRSATSSSSAARRCMLSSTSSNYGLGAAPWRGRLQPPPWMGLEAQLRGPTKPSSIVPASDAAPFESRGGPSRSACRAPMSSDGSCCRRRSAFALGHRERLHRALKERRSCRSLRWSSDEAEMTITAGTSAAGSCGNSLRRRDLLVIEMPLVAALDRTARAASVWFPYERDRGERAHARTREGPEGAWWDRPDGRGARWWRSSARRAGERRRRFAR